jgi:hypothetical protein
MSASCKLEPVSRCALKRCRCGKGAIILLFIIIIIILLYYKNLPYSPVMPHMGHETEVGAYPSGGEHSARMLMTPMPLESHFN